MDATGRALLLSCLAACACAHKSSPTPAAATAPKQPVEMDPLLFQAKPQGGVEIVSADQLFAAAAEAFGKQEYAAARDYYERLVTDFAGSRFVRPSLYNGALAREQLGDLDGAAARLRRLMTEFPTTTDALDAAFRLGAVNEQRKDWRGCVALFDEILRMKDLSTSDRIEALARKGAAQFQAGEHTNAERTLGEAIELVRRNEGRTDGGSERLDTEFFVGMSRYYLGELAHAEFRAHPVRLPESQMAKDLEAKGRLLLRAQARYLDTIRVKEPGWATRAGYQIGELYRQLYDVLVGAPVPPKIEGEAKEVYIEEVKKQVRGLLRRALRIHEQNVLMAERIGAKNEWVTRSGEQLAELEQALLPGAPVDTPAARPEGAPPPVPTPPPSSQDAPRP